jgi:hypothetical protein
MQRQTNRAERAAHAYLYGIAYWPWELARNINMVNGKPFIIYDGSSVYMMLVTITCLAEANLPQASGCRSSRTSQSEDPPKPASLKLAWP